MIDEGVQYYIRESHKGLFAGCRLLEEEEAETYVCISGTARVPYGDMSVELRLMLEKLCRLHSKHLATQKFLCRALRIGRNKCLKILKEGRDKKLLISYKLLRSNGKFYTYAYRPITYGVKLSPKYKITANVSTKKPKVRTYSTSSVRGEKSMVQSEKPMVQDYGTRNVSSMVQQDSQQNRVDGGGLKINRLYIQHNPTLREGNESKLSLGGSLQSPQKGSTPAYWTVRAMRKYGHYVRKFLELSADKKFNPGIARRLVNAIERRGTIDEEKVAMLEYLVKSGTIQPMTMMDLIANISRILGLDDAKQSLREYFEYALDRYEIYLHRDDSRRFQEHKLHRLKDTIYELELRNPSVSEFESLLQPRWYSPTTPPYALIQAARELKRYDLLDQANYDPAYVLSKIPNMESWEYLMRECANDPEEFRKYFGRDILGDYKPLYRDFYKEAQQAFAAVGLSLPEVRERIAPMVGKRFDYKEAARMVYPEAFQPSRN